MQVGELDVELLVLLVEARREGLGYLGSPTNFNNNSFGSPTHPTHGQGEEEEKKKDRISSNIYYGLDTHGGLFFVVVEKEDERNASTGINFPFFPSSFFVCF